MNTNHSTLWRITRGQRLRYLYAILAMAGTNTFMFGAPLVAKYAIDVVVEKDLSLAAPGLDLLARGLGGAEARERGAKPERPYSRGVCFPARRRRLRAH